MDSTARDRKGRRGDDGNVIKHFLERRRRDLVFATDFFARPLRRGFDLVTEARTEIIRYGNVSGTSYERTSVGQLATIELSKPQAEQLRIAQDTFRRPGAELQTLAKTERLATWTLEFIWGLRLLDAGVACIGLSTTIHEYGSQRAAFFQRIETTLCFTRD